MTDFEEALVEFHQEDAGNAFALRQLRADALNRILNGGGVITTVINGSLNGKSHAVQISHDAAQLVAALKRVFDAVAGRHTIARSVQCDYSEVRR